MDNTQPTLTDNQFIINSDDGHGNINVMYQVNGTQYTQDLMNIDDSSGANLLAAVGAYVGDAVTQLSAPVQTAQVEKARLAVDVAAVIGTVQTSQAIIEVSPPTIQHGQAQNT